MLDFDDNVDVKKAQENKQELIRKLKEFKLNYKRSTNTVLFFEVIFQHNLFSMM